MNFTSTNRVIQEGVALKFILRYIKNQKSSSVKYKQSKVYSENRKRRVSIKSERGILIDFEGIDGSGKTTQAEMILNHLSSQGIPVKLFREPTNGKYGIVIRDILSGRSPKRSPGEVLDLFIKDREENVALNIQPALKKKDVVLLDRYYYSTMAYQGALGIDVEEIRAKNESFAPKPDLVLIFLVRVEKALSRIRAGRENGTDNYERETFLVKVDKIFRSFKDSQIRYINGERPLLLVNQEVKGLIDAFLGARDP